MNYESINIVQYETPNFERKKQVVIAMIANYFTASNKNAAAFLSSWEILQLCLEKLHNIQICLVKFKEDENEFGLCSALYIASLPLVKINYFWFSIEFLF